jgi:glycosyltransferase involved in cell wall biosynthesis
MHPAFWPEIGGVQNVMRDQARLLSVAGHEVKIIAGTGEDDAIQLVPELAANYELNVAVRTVLERGQADHNFAKYQSVLVEALGVALTGIDLTIVHNCFTTHQNLVLTRSLHDLAPYHRMIAWTHDLTATNGDDLPNPTKPPWNLMRTAAPEVTYVAASELRADEIKAHLKPAPEPVIIPNAADPVRLFGLTPEIADSLPSLNLPSRDFVFLLPAPVTLRKNVEFALQVVQKLVEAGRNPLLIITGPPIAQSTAAAKYGEYLRQTMAKELLPHVVFVSDFFPIDDLSMRDLYLLADCLLFPSTKEGFGLPIIEAALHRMPIWCNKIPAFWATHGEGAFLLDDLAKVAEATAWLEALPTFRSQHSCRQMFDPARLYQTYYEPLLARFAAP